VGELGLALMGKEEEDVDDFATIDLLSKGQPGKEAAAYGADAFLFFEKEADSRRTATGTCTT
jgi:hypothetical protein